MKISLDNNPFIKQVQTKQITITQRTQLKDNTIHMQTKSKLKSKKTSEILNSINEPLTQNEEQSYDFVQVGAMCGDGTFTENTGRGAGSHHNGIRYKLYARMSEISPSEKCLTFKSTSTSSTFPLKSQQNNLSKDQNQKTSTSPLSPKKKPKKTSLKQSFRTKAKKSSMYQKLNEIFDDLYKDQLPIVQQQLDDGLWLIVAAVCNLYEELEETMGLVRELEGVKQKQLGQKEIDKNDIEVLQVQIKALKKENQSLTKQIQKLTKANSQLTQQLSQLKLRQKNFKKMLKFIQKQNPKILINALQQSKLDIKDLKKHKQPQNRVTTRSMLKKQQSKLQDTRKDSLFSSDQEVDSFNEDNTIVGLLRGMK